MAQALSLARLALGQVSPNPAVGAVVVKDGIIVGQGYTQPPGGDHAEIVALKESGAHAKGSVLYVTLEPCVHHGRTPPCIDFIINTGVAEVHIATFDDNPLVAGKGREALENAGVKVFTGEEEIEARQLNEAYFKFIKTGLPFVTAKYAMSVDGKIATREGDSHWISGEEPELPLHCAAKTRYRQPDQACVVEREDEGYRATFTQPQRAITPGQSAVFYQGEHCLGGGVIEEAGQ